MSSSRQQPRPVPPCAPTLAELPERPAALPEGTRPWAAWESPVANAGDRLTRLVSTLHQEIIPRLVHAHPPVASTARAPQAMDVDGFTALVLDRDDTAIDIYLALLRDRGSDLTHTLSDLLAPTARRIGQLWDDDRVHFVDVTIALGRLQQIMRRLSSAYGTDVDLPTSGRRVLLMPAPGEQHTFGIAMVAEFFTRAGWDVAGAAGPNIADVQRRVKYEWFDLVGISAGSEERVDAIQRCIALIRKQSPNRSIAVLVGGPLFLAHPDLVAQVGADGSADDGQQAPQLAEQLLARRVGARAA